MFISYKGTVYACGENLRGQCAQDLKHEYVVKPKKVRDLEGLRIRFVDCKSLSMAISTEGRVFIWGPFGSQDLFQPVWIQDLENCEITSGAVGNNEIVLIEKK